MSTLGILTIYIKILTRNTTRFKKKKNYTNIFKLDMIMTNTKEKKGNNPSNFDDKKDKRKIKITKPDKYYNKKEKLKP